MLFINFNVLVFLFMLFNMNSVIVVSDIVDVSLHVFYCFIQTFISLIIFDYLTLYLTVDQLIIILFISNFYVLRSLYIYVAMINKGRQSESQTGIRTNLATFGQKFILLSFVLALLINVQKKLDSQLPWFFHNCSSN